MMLTTDLALKLDPIYGPISKRFHENPDQLADAFAKAWYKLLHRAWDRCRASRPVGTRTAAVAGPRTRGEGDVIGEADVAALKQKILESGLTVSQLV